MRCPAHNTPCPTPLGPGSHASSVSDRGSRSSTAGAGNREAGGQAQDLHRIGDGDAAAGIDVAPRERARACETGSRAEDLDAVADRRPAVVVGVAAHGVGRCDATLGVTAIAVDRVAFYWSSSTYSTYSTYDSRDAWGVLFNDGDVLYDNKALTYHVRAVRAGL